MSAGGALLSVGLKRSVDFEHCWRSQRILVAGGEDMSESFKKFDVRVIGIIEQIMNSSNPDIVDTAQVGEIAFHDYIMMLLKEKRISKGKMLDDILVERSYGYQMLNGRRTPTRMVIIRIILYLGLDLRESQFLLAVTGKQALYPFNAFEAAIIYAISHGMSLESTEELLMNKGLGSLYDGGVLG